MGVIPAELASDVEQAKRARDRLADAKGKLNGKAKSKSRPPIELTRTLASIAKDALDQTQRRREGGEVPVMSPWPTLDACVGGGLWPGLHMIVAGSGAGKSQLSLQLTLHAARAGVPVALIELELDPNQVALRVLSEMADVSWSRALRGLVSDVELSRLHAARELLPANIRCDFKPASGWHAPRLEQVAAEMRGHYPSGPLLIVFDYLQRIDSDPKAARRLDLREVIGQASGHARRVAVQHNAAVLVISSTARDNYGKLAKDIGKMLRVERGRFGSRRVLTGLGEAELIGVGKESGEIEYDADSVTVLLRPEITLGSCDPVIDDVYDKGGRIVIAATSKSRVGTSYDTATGWTALSFRGGRFMTLPEEAVNSLGGAASNGQVVASADPLDKVRAVVAAVENTPEPIKNVAVLCSIVGGKRAVALSATQAAIRAGHIRFNPIEKRYMLGPVPLPAQSEQPITSATPSAAEEISDDDQGQLF
jgi:replicative DNA helicase